METFKSDSIFIVAGKLLETKYRDIADGNKRSNNNFSFHLLLETKYRDIADGNNKPKGKQKEERIVGNQVPRYSGWKPK